LLGQLQDRGNVELVKHYLFLLECAYLYRGLEKYSRKEYLKKSSSPKILPLCPALCTYTGSSALWREPDYYGRLFETAVGLVLNRLPGKLYYWREGKDEVDFVYEEDHLFAIEVKSGKRSARNGLQAFQKSYPDATLVILTPANYESFEADPHSFLELMRATKQGNKEITP
jgi:predicted AAA+ superfamily ATPase